MNIIFKQATFEDALGIQSVNSMCLPVSYSIPEYVKFITRKNYLVHISLHNSKIIGYIITEIQQVNYHIISISVLPEYRRQQVATRLIDSIHRDKLYISLYVMVSFKESIYFYEKYGFTIHTLKRHYYGIDVDGFEMRFNCVN